MDVVVLSAWISGCLTLTGSVVAAVYARSGNRMLRTNHGKTIGEHVEDLVTWSHIHTEQDNEIRDALGLPRASYPDLTAWKNER